MPPVDPKFGLKAIYQPGEPLVVPLGAGRWYQPDIRYFSRIHGPFGCGQGL